MAAKHWPAFMPRPRVPGFLLEPAYWRELEEHERHLREEWEEAQDEAAKVRADEFEKGSPA